MKNNLKDKIAIVTGGSRGIGRGIVLKLADLGCHIAFNYLKSESEANKLCDDVLKLGVRCIKSRVDVADFEAAKEWIASIKKEFDKIDILINNAGIICDKPLMMMGEKEWQQVMGTNLNGMYNVSRHCIVSFMKQKSGNIINISSVSGIIGLAGQTNYSASKGGMNAFTKALAKEVAAYNVRVNAVAPGFIMTDIIGKLNDQQLEQIQKEVPLGRIGEVQDVSDCVAFLLSEDARYITGQVITVDGGLAMR